MSSTDSDKDSSILSKEVLQQLTKLPDSPLTINDIISYLQNPYSLLRITLQSFISEIVNLKILQELTSKLIKSKAAVAALIQIRSTYNRDLELRSANKPYIIGKTIANEIDLLAQQLAKEESLLSALCQKRNIILSSLLLTWHNQQENQVKRLVTVINPILGSIGLANLTDEQQEVLSNVAKMQQIQLAHPEVIPISANMKTEETQEIFTTAKNKADLNFELTLSRLILNLEDGNNIRPSELKKLKLIKKVLNEHFKKSHTADEQLAASQISQTIELQNLKQQIIESQQKIVTIKTEVGLCEQKLNMLTTELELTGISRFSNAISAKTNKTKLHTASSISEFINDFASWQTLTPMEFINTLTHTYQNMHYSAYAKKNNLANFEYVLTRAIKNVEGDKIPALFKTIDDMYAQLAEHPPINYNRLAVELMNSLMSVKEDLSPSAVNHWKLIP